MNTPLNLLARLREPSSLGVRLSTDPGAFGEMRDSTDAEGDIVELRNRLAEDGYLLLRGLLDPEQVARARGQVLGDLALRGMVVPGTERMALPLARVSVSGFEAEDRRLDQVRQLALHGRMRAFYERLLEAPARGFDYLWMRIMAPMQATGPHCDIVYMNRGTQELYTSWIPLTPVSILDGPLMVLEGSHLIPRLREGYGRMDVDRDRSWRRFRLKHGRPVRGGDYSRDPRRVQAEFGKRWATSEFTPGDVVVFGPFLMHGSLDNRSRSFRLSVDARFQRASDPVDERWVGERPPGHQR